jgi:3-methyladenine DNA glycosylase AlkD
VKHRSASKEEFIKRAVCALLASLAPHAKSLGDEPFMKCMPLIERGAQDERNFVKKRVSWALRDIDARKSPALRAASLQVAKRLAEPGHSAARRVGKDVLRAFTKK